MQVGDPCLFYHSNEGKEVVGVAEVIKEHYQDPTIDDDRWVAVDVKPVKQLDHPVSLKAIKANPNLQEMGLVRQGRLSVVELSKADFDEVLKMSENP